MNNYIKYNVFSLLLTICSCSKTDIDKNLNTELTNYNSTIIKSDVNSSLRITLDTPTKVIQKFNKFELIFISSGPLKGEFISAKVLMPDGYVTIGGGDNCSTSSEIGFITSSYPSDDLKGWIGSSRSKYAGAKHESGVWAVGLKIYGVNPNELLSNITVFSKSYTSNTLSIATTAKVTDDHILMGGGASHPIGISASYSSNNSKWYAESLRLQNNVSNNNNTITSYAIGLKRSFAEKYKIKINYNNFSEINEPKYSGGTKELRVYSNLNSGYAIFNCGGYEETSTSRGIVSLYPTMDQYGILKTSAKYNQSNNGKGNVCTFGIKID